MNLGKKDLYPKSYCNHVVGKNDESITCIRCKKCYKPSNEDVSVKNRGVYYKTCLDCRNKSTIYARGYIKKKMENKILI
tara:strand:- start:168 stop:404 length:237 start_codon:yes stop_codon:yes gene_type:complete